MNQVKHVIITLIFSIVFYLFFDSSFGFKLIIISVLATLIIDTIDHSIAILTYNSPFNKETRSLIFSGQIVDAYKSYCSKRKGVQSKLILHNWPVVIICLLSMIISFILNNHMLVAIFGFGLSLHYLCDLYEDIILKQNLKYWFGEE